MAKHDKGHDLAKNKFNSIPFKDNSRMLPFEFLILGLFQKIYFDLNVCRVTEHVFHVFAR